MSRIYWYSLDTPNLDEAWVSEVLQELWEKINHI